MICIAASSRQQPQHGTCIMKPLMIRWNGTFLYDISWLHVFLWTSLDALPPDGPSPIPWTFPSLPCRRPGAAWDLGRISHPFSEIVLPGFWQRTLENHLQMCRNGLLCIRRYPGSTFTHLSFQLRDCFPTKIGSHLLNEVPPFLHFLIHTHPCAGAYRGANKNPKNIWQLCHHVPPGHYLAIQYIKIIRPPGISSRTTLIQEILSRALKLAHAIGLSFS